jgi:hypothetical protein
MPMLGYNYVLKLRLRVLFGSGFLNRVTKSTIITNVVRIEME